MARFDSLERNPDPACRSPPHLAPAERAKPIEAQIEEGRHPLRIGYLETGPTGREIADRTRGFRPCIISVHENETFAGKRTQEQKRNIVSMLT
jgi:hypothetical protein